MTRERIKEWLDLHTLLWKVRRDNQDLLNSDEAPGINDFNASICGLSDGVHLYVWNSEIYFKLISILQATVTFNPNKYDGEQIYASFIYNGVEVFTLLDATKGGN